MHENNIELLREEALRLIALEQKTLSAMREAPGLLTQEKQGQVQTLDQQSAQAHVEMLTGEALKLQKLDMVLAVVGTMKAGKSTTINAIVGTEVLPNRNAPMTAIPTLIRHTPGQIEPQLTLQHVAPLQALRSAIGDRLPLPQYADEIKRLGQSADDLHDLIAEIRRNTALVDSYTGAESIFSFLKGVNDLVRLAPKVGLEFPFREFASVDTLPVICVEFAHLDAVAGNAGTLTLLDTPGPNEEGQSRLRPMLKEQLSKASAVLAVLDYTQLKSEADAEVRQDLSEIASVAKGRLYALVNKFDQKDRNGMNEEEVRNFVLSLMSGEQGALISKENIFPVSSKLAYLGNRARHANELNGCLPDPASEPWVADFGALAFGAGWEDDEDFTQTAEIKAKSEKLWKTSRFNQPLEGVIRVAHAHAAILAMDSAAAKLVNVATAIHNLCTTRELALLKDASELQSLVKSLQDDIQKIDQCEQSAVENQKRQLQRFAAELECHFVALKADTGASLSRYFKEGKLIERKIIEEMSNVVANSMPNWPLKKFFNLLSTGSTRGEEQHFNPNSPEINFYQDKQAARTLIQRIEASVAAIYKDTNSAIEKGLDELLPRFEEDFRVNVVKTANDVLSELQRKMAKEGFSALTISLPTQGKLQLKISGAQMLANVIEENERSETRRCEQDSFGSGAKRWFGGLFNKDWGYDSYTVQVTDHKVNINKIREQVMASVDASFAGLDRALSNQAQQPLQRTVDEFFAAFRTTVESIRGDLLQSLEDKAQRKDAQQALLASLSHLKKSIPAQLTDAQALDSEVKRQLSVGMPSMTSVV